ncbi:uncharacterized protein B0T15DRAFT_250674 [Chaetomium strumarium]|uniref:GRF-like zinc ribbon domain-containing protein n=1 Tax=Chaetomium strumarium TaxID=1170767 RepID=A0AAJ0M0P7_9PEZI|nr:hypothetical protein B0T15DRAFT_250674 [Chaetomium strumarium]
MEPRFPLLVPPTCRRCGNPCTRFPTGDWNSYGNAGRPFYSCRDYDRHTESVFGCFDDAIGVSHANPPCLCGYFSRRTRRNDGESHFFSCPVGRCGWSLTDYTSEGTPSQGVLASPSGSSPGYSQAAIDTLSAQAAPSANSSQQIVPPRPVLADGTLSQAGPPIFPHNGNSHFDEEESQEPVPQTLHTVSYHESAGEISKSRRRLLCCTVM